MTKVPCGNNMGHGDYCVENHLCDQCATIATLEARVRELEAYIEGMKIELQKKKLISL